MAQYLLGTLGMQGILPVGPLAILTSITLALGCVGDAPKNGDGDGEPGEVVGESARFPRLTNDQWQQTVTSLLYLDAPLDLDAELQADPPLGRFDNNIARLAFSSSHWRSFQRAAEEVAKLASATPSIVTAISPADVPTDAEEAGRAFIQHFGPRAYRRPITDQEVDRYVAVFLEGSGHYPDQATYEAGLRLVLETMLQSPYFLYRVEASETVSGESVALDDYEIASRLSFAFWNTMPSDELFAAAKAGEFSGETAVRAMAETMFDDERTVGQFRSFHTQAFEMAEYRDLDKNPDLFPDWSRDVGASMLDEAALFLGGEVFGGGGVRELLTSTRGYVNAELAALYGLEGNFGEEFVKVDLDPAERSGILTRLGFLTKNATLSQSDPIHRGVFVNLNLICQPFTSVPNLPDTFDYVGDTNRERINSVTGPGTCGGSCHGELINPIGFALENYDALGQYRTEESGFPVDAADVYTFASGRKIEFANGLELSEQLANSPEVHACYIQQLLEYLLGRDLGEQDMLLVEKYAAESFENNLSIREIVLRVVASHAFRFRAITGGGA